MRIYFSNCLGVLQLIHEMLWIGSQKASQEHQEPTKGKIDQPYPTVIGFSIGLEGKLYRNPPFFFKRRIPWVFPGFPQCSACVAATGRRTWLEQFMEAVNATDEGILGMWNIYVFCVVQYTSNMYHTMFNPWQQYNMNRGFHRGW